MDNPGRGSEGQRRCRVVVAGCTVLLGDVGVAYGAPEMEAGGDKPQRYLEKSGFWGDLGRCGGSWLTSEKILRSG